MTKITVWTDFGIPSTRHFPTEAQAIAYGEHCLKLLGCMGFKIAGRIYGRCPEAA